jgi:hypothetical protein
MRRRPVSLEDRLHPLHRWFAHRTPAGIWVIVDEAGDQPLRALDPVDRCSNIHLAAAAPVLRHELRRIAQRFSRVCREDGTEQYVWNWKYIAAAYWAISESRPLYAETCRASEGAAQLEIELDEAA